MWVFNIRHGKIEREFLAHRFPSIEADKRLRRKDRLALRVGLTRAKRNPHDLYLRAAPATSSSAKVYRTACRAGLFWDELAQWKNLNGRAPTNGGPPASKSRPRGNSALIDIRGMLGPKT